MPMTTRQIWSRLVAAGRGSSVTSHLWTALSLVVAVLLASSAARTAAPRFYPDDPLWVDDDKALDAGGVEEHEDKNSYDFVNHTFIKPGERRQVRALNVNTVDEVPDSSWFTNRVGREAMSIEALVRGPDTQPALSLDAWVVSGGKGTGLQPGFRMTDPKGHLYQVEVDPDANPELATGAEIIGTAFYHAFGYHVVDVYIAELDPAKVVVSPKATMKDPLNGRRRKMTRRDVSSVLRRTRRQPNGTYRVIASRFAEGRPAGNFRYFGTRTDDPNDVVPHEHRRELRGARVFGAWLNHDDSRGVNSLDFVIDAGSTPGSKPGSKHWVKHYMFDFGSIMGSGTVRAQAHRAGNEYIFEWAPGWLTLGTLGFYARPWMRIDYPDVPKSVGRFEGDAFDPLLWKPEYPNPAFANMRPDDAFWAARIVSRFDERMVRALVEKARYSDRAATDYVSRVLMARRDKVLRAWLNGVSPVVDAALDASGRLTFVNAAAAAAVASAAEHYTLQWFAFDNLANTRSNAGDAVQVTALEGRAPSALLQGHDYIGVSVTAHHRAQPGWAIPATLYFRKNGAAWQLVGVDREPASS